MNAPGDPTINTEANFRQTAAFMYFDPDRNARVLISAPEEAFEHLFDLSIPESIPVFDQRHVSDIQKLSFEWIRLSSYHGNLTNAVQSTPTSEVQKIRSSVLSLIYQALRSFAACVDLLRRGYRTAIGAIARNIVESTSTAICIWLKDGCWEQFQKGTLKTTKTRNYVAGIYPGIRDIYSWLSDEFVHVSKTAGEWQSYELERSDDAVVVLIGLLKHCLLIVRLCLEIVFYPDIQYPQLIDVIPQPSGTGVKIKPKPQSDYLLWFLENSEAK